MKALLFTLLLIGPSAMAAQNPSPAQTAPAGQNTAALPAVTEGQHYRVVADAAQARKGEVVEFFSYTCPACFGIEPFMQDWHKQKPADAHLRRVHVVNFVNHPGAEIMARAFYTAEVLGMSEKVHSALFEMYHVQRKPPQKNEDIAELFAKFGADRANVLSVMTSFAVEGKMRATEQLQKTAGFGSIPSFLINNRYATDGRMAQSYEMMNKILNELPLR